MELKVNKNNSIYFPENIRSLKNIQEGSEFEVIEQNGDFILKLKKKEQPVPQA